MGVGVVLGVDGGNSKTELVAASLDGDALAYVRGAGSNAHGPLGVDGTVAVLAELVARARVELPAAHAAFLLCGADATADVDALQTAIDSQRWADAVFVDNDTFALLRVGSDAPDAVAVVCGAGINVVGRRADGRVARFPSLGWQTGDWGGAEELGREALYFAARGEDGRGEPTVLTDAIRRHFGKERVEDVGADVYYRRMRHQRLGELAPAIVAAADAGDAVARALVLRLADEIALLAERALRALELLDAPVDVVLGGGMMRERVLVDWIAERLAARTPRARPLVASDPPALGAALLALDAAGAPPAAAERLRAAFRVGLEPEDVRGG